MRPDLGYNCIQLIVLGCMYYCTEQEAGSVYAKWRDEQDDDEDEEGQGRRNAADGATGASQAEELGLGLRPSKNASGFLYVGNIKGTQRYRGQIGKKTLPRRVTPAHAALDAAKFLRDAKTPCILKGRAEFKREHAGSRMRKLVQIVCVTGSFK